MLLKFYSSADTVGREHDEFSTEFMANLLSVSIGICLRLFRKLETRNVLNDNKKYIAQIKSLLFSLCNGKFKLQLEGYFPFFSQIKYSIRS